MKRRLLSGLLLALVCSFGLVACNNQDSSETDGGEYATVHFDANTDMATNKIRDQEVKIGKKVRKPSVFLIDDNPFNLNVQSWHLSKDLGKAWDFKHDVVTGSMTLYAKWEELCQVRYFLGDDPKPVKETEVFRGEYAKDYPSLVAGYRYLGAYADPEYQTKFDFNAPLTGNTDIYLKRSEGIYFADMPMMEGEILPTTLSENLTAGIGSYLPDAEVGYIERRELANGEVCSYINFGYTPAVPDPFVSIDLNLDIRASQIIRLTFKNLGPATSMSIYFYSLIDLETYTFSKTGGNYSGPYHVRVPLSAEQKNMDPEGEWSTIDFDLSSIYADGYSVWGTSPYMGAIRIQAEYKNTSPEDLNEFLFRSIEGVKKEIDTRDTPEIDARLSDDDAEAVAAAKAAQTAKDHSLVFPLDSDAILEEKSSGFDTYEKTNGLMIHTDNEINRRGHEDDPCVLSFGVKGKEIDLEEYPTLSLTLQNFGYATEIGVYLCNDEYDTLIASVPLEQKMTEARKTTLNLYKQSGMYGKLNRIELHYEPMGVDNAILLKEIALEDYKPYDIQGLNFNDKSTCGFVTTPEVGVSFNASASGTKFDVASSGASIEKTFDKRVTIGGYYGFTLSFVEPTVSQLTALEISFQVNGVTYAHQIALDLDARGNKAQKITLPFEEQEQGMLEKMAITFTGTGSLTIKSMEWDPGEYAIRYDKNYAQIFSIMEGWLSGADYGYDTTENTSIFIKQQDSLGVNCSLYIGWSTLYHPEAVYHECLSPKMSDFTTINVVYQNRTAVDEMSFSASPDRTESAPGDGSGISPITYSQVPILANMQEYEWATLTLEIPESAKSYYLAKVNFTFSGAELRVRMINVR